jgi:NCS1 family nucleobase:cation symporter-1
VCVDDLFTLDEQGAYHYKKGYNPAAIYATVIAAAAALASVFVPGVNRLDDYSWFVGCGVALAAYALIAPRLGVNVRTLDARKWTL